MVEYEADVVAIESDRAIDVTHREYDNLQGPVHDHFLELC
jgi:hypothetical protein